MANKTEQRKRKPGGGRKPKAFTLLKRQLIKDGIDDAAYAYSLYVSVMRDNESSMDLRLDCAREVLDRVLGKAKQPQEMSGQTTVILKVQRDRTNDRTNGTPDQAAREATGDKGQPSEAENSPSRAA